MRFAAFGALALAALASAAFQCDVVETSFGLDAITAMKTPQDSAPTCPVMLPEDTHQDERASCAFGRGATVEETLGVSSADAATIPIRHVLIVMKENRSFDHILGHLHDEGQPDAEPLPDSFANRDLEGNTVTTHRAGSTCIGVDPDHQWTAMHDGIAHGAMSGFVGSAARTTGTSGHFAVSHYDQDDLPFYHWLASTFALNDRHFSSMPTGTYGNRSFLLFGTNAGIVDSGLSFPDPSMPSIFRALMKKGFTWGVYTDGIPFSGTLDWDGDDPGVRPFSALLTALDEGRLPNVAFVDGLDGVDDDHPPADLQAGEAWMRKIYQHAARSPQWGSLAIIWTYDEGGGFADHVPPPRGCVARPGDSAFFELGVRVPFVVISPWAKRHYVSHVVEEHTAITRFLELLFDLPAFTARDANAPALLDLFDFTCNRDMTPPDAVATGTGGCVADP